MDVSAIPPSVVVKAPEVPVFKAPENRPDVLNGEPADGTRSSKPPQVAALPPGQGTRIDRFV